MGVENDQSNISSGYAASPTGTLLAKTLAVFASDQYRFGDALMVDMGCRWDRVDYHYENLSTVWPTLESGTRAFEQLSPALGLTAYPEGDMSGFANISRAFKVPPFEDFAVFSPSYNANPKIGPQISDTFEAGIRGKGLVLWQIAGYQSSIQDEILYNDSLFSNENVDTIHQGASIKVGCDVGLLSLDFNAVLDRGWIVRGSSGSLLTGRTIPNIPDWVAKVRVNYMWSKCVTSYLQGRFVGENSPLNDYEGLQKQPGFGVFDAGIKCQLSDWLLSVDIWNVWDARFPEEVAVNWSGALDIYPAPGRIWTGSFSWSF